MRVMTLDVALAKRRKVFQIDRPAVRTFAFFARPRLLFLPSPSWNSRLRFARPPTQIKQGYCIVNILHIEQRFIRK